MVLMETDIGSDDPGQRKPHQYSQKRNNEHPALRNLKLKWYLTRSLQNSQLITVARYAETY